MVENGNKGSEWDGAERRKPGKNWSGLLRNLESKWEEERELLKKRLIEVERENRNLKENLSRRENELIKGYERKEQELARENERLKNELERHKKLLNIEKENAKENTRIKGEEISSCKTELKKVKGDTSSLKKEKDNKTKERERMLQIEKKDKQERLLAQDEEINRLKSEMARRENELTLNFDKQNREREKMFNERWKRELKILKRDQDEMRITLEEKLALKEQEIKNYHLEKENEIMGIRGDFENRENQLKIEISNLKVQNENLSNEIDALKRNFDERLS